MIQTPQSLQAHMQQHIGVSLNSIDDNEQWHSGKRISGDPSGKVSYVTAHTDKGLLVRYRHKGGDCFTWKSWADGEGEYIPAPRKPAKPVPVINDMPVMMKAWNEAGRVDLHHPYIEKKLIIPIGIRQVSKRYVIRTATPTDPEHYLSTGTLLIPAYSNTTGEIIGFETITSLGRKFARGDRKSVHLWIGGNAGTGDGCIYIAEGYSTGVSVHMRTRGAVVAAFSTSGLLPAGKMLRQRYPDAQIVFAVDNDVGVMFQADGEKRENPGLYYSEKAAKAIEGKLWMPPTSDKADWNDVHVSMCPDKKTPVQF